MKQVLCKMSVQCRLLIWGMETTEAGPVLAPEALWGYLGDRLGHPNPVECNLVRRLQLIV